MGIIISNENGLDIIKIRNGEYRVTGSFNYGYRSIEGGWVKNSVDCDATFPENTSNIEMSDKGAYDGEWKYYNVNIPALDIFIKVYYPWCIYILDFIVYENYGLPESRKCIPIKYWAIIESDLYKNGIINDIDTDFFIRNPNIYFCDADGLYFFYCLDEYSQNKCIAVKIRLMDLLGLPIEKSSRLGMMQIERLYPATGKYKYSCERYINGIIPEKYRGKKLDEVGLCASALNLLKKKTDAYRITGGDKKEILNIFNS